MTRHCSECGVSEDDLGFGDSFNEAVSSDGKALAYCGGCWRAVVDRREWEQRGRALKVDRLVVAIEHLFDHEHDLSRTEMPIASFSCCARQVMTNGSASNARRISNARSRRAS